VEEALLAAPSVKDVAVCSVPDATGASRLVAYVVAEPGYAADQARTGLDLIRELRGKVPAQKVPAKVVFVPGLPRTPTGKLRRRVLRAMGATYQATGAWPEAQ